MKFFYYKPNWYPYYSQMKAKNLSDAWERLAKMFSEYDVRKCFSLL